MRRPSQVGGYPSSCRLKGFGPGGPCSPAFNLLQDRDVSFGCQKYFPASQSPCICICQCDSFVPQKGVKRRLTGMSPIGKKYQNVYCCLCWASHYIESLHYLGFNSSKKIQSSNTWFVTPTQCIQLKTISINLGIHRYPVKLRCFFFPIWKKIAPNW